MREQQSRATQERHERMLNALFQTPGNDRCADCTAKNPRWASYSIGVFLCIRCASLHRKMGTHVSKVKSVSMDRWTLQEIQLMTNLGGNSTLNRQINTNPQKHPLPIALDDDHAMEKYIRDKWEKKLFQEEQVPVVTTSNTTKITELQQIGDSNLSLASTATSSTSYSQFEQQIMHTTPSLSSESSGSLSSPSTFSPLAGRVSPPSTLTSTSTNPFMMQPSTSPYNPFSSSSTSSVTPSSYSSSNNNPFLTNQPLQQSPFEFHENTSYFPVQQQQQQVVNRSNPFLF